MLFTAIMSKGWGLCRAALPDPGGMIDNVPLEGLPALHKAPAHK